MTAATRTPVASWWVCGPDRWLEVVAETRAGVTDGMSARDHVGPGSWEHDGRVYLAEPDAVAWLAASGLVEQDVRSRWMGRRPDGFRKVRDAAVADAAAGVGSDAYWAAREAECYPPDGFDADGVPLPVTPPDGDGCRRLRKAERRARNRALAARVRELGLTPNGDVWAAAKRLHAAGHVITLDTLTVAGVTR